MLIYLTIQLHGGSIQVKIGSPKNAYTAWNLCNKVIIEVCCFPGHFVCCHISKSISLHITQAFLFSSINKNMEVLLYLQMWPGMRKQGLCAQNTSHSHYSDYLTFFVSYKHSISCIKFCIVCFIGCKVPLINDVQAQRLSPSYFLILGHK